jgi:hypothetical protein
MSDLYEDRAITTVLELLMNNDITKYDLKVQEGTWNALDDQEATIMALQA